MSKNGESKLQGWRKKLQGRRPLLRRKSDMRNRLQGRMQLLNKIGGRKMIGADDIALQATEISGRGGPRLIIIAVVIDKILEKIGDDNMIPRRSPIDNNRSRDRQNIREDRRR